MSFRQVNVKMSHSPQGSLVLGGGLQAGVQHYQNTCVFRKFWKFFEKQE